MKRFLICDDKITENDRCVIKIIGIHWSFIKIPAAVSEKPLFHGMHVMLAKAKHERWTDRQTICSFVESIFTVQKTIASQIGVYTLSIDRQTERHTTLMTGLCSFVRSIYTVWKTVAGEIGVYALPVDRQTYNTHDTSLLLRLIYLHSLENRRRRDWSLYTVHCHNGTETDRHTILTTSLCSFVRSIYTVWKTVTCQIGVYTLSIVTSELVLTTCCCCSEKNMM